MRSELTKIIPSKIEVAEPLTEEAVVPTQEVPAVELDRNALGIYTDPVTQEKVLCLFRFNGPAQKVEYVKELARTSFEYEINERFKIEAIDQKVMDA